MITIEIQIDEDFDELNLTEDQMVNGIEDAFARGVVTPFESVAAEVISIDWE